MSAAAKKIIRGWKALKPMPQGGRRDHGCCEIDDRRMIIVGGLDAVNDSLASGMIYDARTELWTPLPNDMPEPLRSFGIAGNDEYVIVFGGLLLVVDTQMQCIGSRWRPSNGQPWRRWVLLDLDALLFGKATAYMCLVVLVILVRG